MTNQSTNTVTCGNCAETFDSDPRVKPYPIRHNLCIACMSFEFAKIKAVATVEYTDTWAGAVTLALVPFKTSRSGKPLTLYRWLCPEYPAAAPSMLPGTIEKQIQRAQCGHAFGHDTIKRLTRPVDGEAWRDTSTNTMGAQIERGREYGE